MVLTRRLCGSPSWSPVFSAAKQPVLRNPINMGDFDWKGQRYDGTHAPIVSRELWDKAQALPRGRYVNRNKKPKRDFAFRGLIRCGHCGCSMVAEIKKSRYYHCSRAKGKCPE